MSFGGLPAYEVVVLHLSQSIETSAKAEHKHRLLSELHAAERHVKTLAESLRHAPDAPDPTAQLTQALAEVEAPEPGKIEQWLSDLTSSVHRRAAR